MIIDLEAPLSQSTHSPADQLIAWARLNEQLHHLERMHGPAEVEHAARQLADVAGELCADLIAAGAIGDADPTYTCPDAACRHDRPVLLLDVDGVLNPELSRDAAQAAGYTRHTFTLPHPYHQRPATITPWLNPRHGHWLRQLTELGVELVWCTSWEHAAAEHIAPVLGLPEMTVVQVGMFGGAVVGGRSAKADAVTAWLGDRPAVWVDDVHGPGDHEWASERTADGKPTLLVTVDPAQGLSSEHIATIIAWLAANQLTTDPAAVTQPPATVHHDVMVTISPGLAAKISAWAETYRDVHARTDAALGADQKPPTTDLDISEEQAGSLLLDIACALDAEADPSVDEGAG